MVFAYGDGLPTAALDAASGTVRWKSELRTPTLLPLEGRHLLACDEDEDTILCVDAGTGTVLSSRDRSSDEPIEHAEADDDPVVRVGIRYDSETFEAEAVLEAIRPRARQEAERAEQQRRAEANPAAADAELAQWLRSLNRDDREQLVGVERVVDPHDSEEAPDFDLPEKSAEYEAAVEAATLWRVPLPDSVQAALDRSWPRSVVHDGEHVVIHVSRYDGEPDLLIALRLVG